MRVLLLSLILTSCGAPDDTKHAGTATIAGTTTGFALASEQGVSIARVYAPTLEIKVSPGGVACEATQGGDRITFDLGDQRAAMYTIVNGYPSKSALSAAQARAHICPKRPEGEDQGDCQRVARGGSVTITKVDDAKGGRIEGSYELETDGGTLTGTFSAYRCN